VWGDGIVFGVIILAVAVVVHLSGALPTERLFGWAFAIAAAPLLFGLGLAGISRLGVEAAIRAERRRLARNRYAEFSGALLRLREAAVDEEASRLVYGLYARASDASRVSKRERICGQGLALARRLVGERIRELDGWREAAPASYARSPEARW
jgi:hypothetical protein